VPNYTYATQQDALTALGSRLYDETFQQWTQAELAGYLVESLRTWNALTSFWRNEMAFQTTANNWWYDLSQQTNSLIPYTVTQSSIINQIENHLLEPPNVAYPLVWAGSRQFSFSDILLACQRRQNETLGVTACTIKRSTPDAPISTGVLLDDTVIDILRVAWLPASAPFTAKPLRQSDRFTQRAFNPFYATAAPQPPNNWMQNTEPPPSFNVDAVPPVPGKYDVLTTNSGPAWVAVEDSKLNIADDWSWVLKWGSLFDLLSRESNSKDSLRAQYCKLRYEEGLKFLENAPTVLDAWINGMPVATSPVRDGDDFNPSWQAAPAGQPTSVYVAGNQLAVAPAPSGAFGVSVAVVQNAPVPIAGSSFIQVARDDFDTIIDYAQHLAMFKSGGTEFSATVPLYQKFQRKAALYNSKLKEMGFFEMTQLEMGQAQEMRSPRYSLGEGPGE